MQIERFTQLDSRAVDRPRWGRWFAVALIASGLTACGGGNDEPPATPGAAIIGAAGGTVRSEDGAQVVFPRDALRGDITVRIAKDSAGAPPLPPAAVPAGAVYTITPHGGAFDELVEVSIPVERADIPGDGQLLLVTAEPGDKQWRVLSGASYYDGKMRAPVMHFSFFQTIRLVNQIMPTLVTKIDGANNIGGAGIARLSALQELPFLAVDDYSPCLGGCPIPANTLVAELSFPTLIAQPVSTVRGIPVPALPATTCRPVDLGHGAMSFLFRREGTQVFVPTVNHRAVVPRDPWPRFPGDGGALTFTDNTTIGRTAFPGFGAIHYYGNETPRIFGLYDTNPPTQAMIERADREQNSTAGRYVLPTGNVYALPPVGDNAADNLYTWRGDVWWSATQNGSVRVDAAIMTTCGLFLEAVPIAFKLDAPPPSGYRTAAMIALTWTEANGTAEGTDVALQFGRYDGLARRWASTDSDVTTYRIDYSPDPMTVDWQPVSTSAVARRQFQIYNNDPRISAQTVAVAGVELILPAVQASQSGYYRVFWCESTGCFDSEAYRLVVYRAPPTISAQPAGQTVQVGQTASFTVATAGAPLPALQWQKRSFVAAAFGFLAWTNIDGATGATYTTPPLALADTATQYRAWASNALGGVPSDIAMLTVVERFTPPVIDAQPGNLNVTVGGTAVFAATVSGPGPLSYQWRRNGVNITGANSAILTLANVTALNDGRYDLVVTNSAGSATTDPGLLQVTLGAPIPLAPAIAASPVSMTVAEGNAANFAVAVTGTGPYTYQWFKSGVPAPVAEGDFPSFSIATVTAADAGAYSVRVTNNVGNVLSAAATLTVSPASGVPLAPTITAAPVALAVLPGSGATFAVAVSGTGPFTYQWRRDGVDIAGATSAVLHIAAVNPLDAGQYAVEVRNATGAASSSSAPLIVIGAPVITQQPAAASASEGNTATLSVAASGNGLLHQWTRNGVGIAGATSASYTTPALTLADSGAVYAVVVYNGAGIAFSQGAVLTVTAAPVLTGPTLASVATSGGAPNNRSITPSLSADGLLVAFHSDGTNLVGGTTGFGHAYLRKLATNTTTLINARPDGGESARGVNSLKLSANGRYAVFTSLANDLVAADTNVADDVFLRDLVSGTTTRLNVLPNGAQDVVSGNAVGGQLDISADGRWVLMSSGVDLAGDGATLPNGVTLFLRDTVYGTTRAVPGLAGYGAASLSTSGLYLVVANATLGFNHLQVHDVQANATSTVFSIGTANFPDGILFRPSISDDGQVIAFGLRSSTLPDYRTYNQIAVFDRGAIPGFELTLQSQTTGEMVGNYHSSNPVLSSDGRHVLFLTNAPNLAGDPAATIRPYLIQRDRQTLVTTVASQRVDGSNVWVGNFGHALSRDGTALAFVADMADMFVPGRLGENQVFVAPRP